MAISKNYHFSTAAHSYFRVLNLAEERSKFIELQDYIPQFKYPNTYSDKRIKNILNRVDDSKADESLRLVLSSLRLQNSDDELSNFRNLNEMLFGTPDELYVKELILHKLDKVYDKSDSRYLYVVNSIGADVLTSQRIKIRPDRAVFKIYRDYFRKYRNQTSCDCHDVLTALKKEVSNSILEKNGWTIFEADDDLRARTIHRKKQIAIGKYYDHRKSDSIDRVVVHEVYGHALRGQRTSVEESEGFALLLEQLTQDNYFILRSYRYLAACLGWGVLGKRMNFREVYEIIWRLMSLTGLYGEDDAKKFAFNECARVFRGGRNDLPGAVFLKDAIYLKANVAIWEKLANNLMEYNEFVDIIEGRREIGL